MSIERLSLSVLLWAGVVSAVLTFAVLRSALGRRILIDTPNARSSHQQPKPRGGGVGVIGGLIFAMALALGGHAPPRTALCLFIGALACAFVGLWDDLGDLSVRPRLLAQFAISAWFVYETGGLSRFPLPSPLDVPLGILGPVFSVVWLMGVTNFFNFMDGIDGLAAGQAIVVCLGVAASAWSVDSSLIALALAGALLGFLPFNWWPSRIFLGDAGSLPVGFLLAGLPLLASVQDRSRAVFAVALSLTLFLLDPVLTLWRRWRRGAPLGQSHREHLYQQFLGPGDAHVAVTTALMVAGILLSATGWLVYRRPPLGWAGVLIGALAFAIEYRLAGRRPGR
jgi:Fuc2NAc and GlcNAc transferase